MMGECITHLVSVSPGQLRDITRLQILQRQDIVVNNLRGYFGGDATFAVICHGLL